MLRSRRGGECCCSASHVGIFAGSLLLLGYRDDAISPCPTEPTCEEPPVVRLTAVVALVVLVLGLVALIRAQRINRASIERDGLSRFRDASRGRYPELLSTGWSISISRMPCW
jgi:hypothetical protein